MAQRGYNDAREGQFKADTTQAYMIAAWQRCQKLPKYEHLFIETPSLESIKEESQRSYELEEISKKQKKKEEYYKRLKDK